MLDGELQLHVDGAGGRPGGGSCAVARPGSGHFDREVLVARQVERALDAHAAEVGNVDRVGGRPSGAGASATGSGAGAAAAGFLSTFAG